MQALSNAFKNDEDKLSEYIAAHLAGQEVESEQEESEEKLEEPDNDSNDDGAAHEGKRVAKYFEGYTDLFIGTVKEYGEDASGEKAWRVEFDDGNDKNFNLSELRAALQLYEEEGVDLDHTKPSST